MSLPSSASCPSSPCACQHTSLLLSAHEILVCQRTRFWAHLETWVCWRVQLILASTSGIHHALACIEIDVSPPSTVFPSLLLVHHKHHSFLIQSRSQSRVLVEPDQVVESNVPRVVVLKPGDVVVREPREQDIDQHSRTSRSRSPVRFIRRQLSRHGINLPLTNTSSGIHRPVIRRASLAFVKQKLWLHPTDQEPSTPARSDIIFEQHEQNVYGDLRRRKTEGDLRKRARFAEERPTPRESRGIRKSKISKRLMERPTVPRVDTGLREQYRRKDGNGAMGSTTRMSCGATSVEGVRWRSMPGGVD